MLTLWSCFLNQLQRCNCAQFRVLTALKYLLLPLRAFIKVDTTTLANDFTEKGSCLIKFNFNKILKNNFKFQIQFWGLAYFSM